MTVSDSHTAEVQLSAVTPTDSIDWAAIPSPAFVLDESRLRRNLALISHIQQQSGARIIVAFKGFSMWSTFPLLREYGISGATASSLNEAILAREEMRGEVHIYAPAYSDEEMPQLLELADHLVFNSFSQWERFKPQVEAARTGGREIHVGIRINPEYAEVETDLYNPAGPFSRLGVTRREFRADLLDGVDGLHFHTLCEKDSDTLERTLEVVERNFGEFLPHMNWVNFGGGHLMTREGYDLERLIRVVRAFREKWGVDVILEPGSAFGWQTGWLVSRVLDIVHNVKDAALLDVSVSAHMPDVLEMPYRPRILGAGDPPEHEHREANDYGGGYPYLIGGTTCLAGDVVGEYVFEKPLKIGDRVVFDDMIHYTMVKTTFFNGVKHPDIGILHLDGSYERIKQFGYEEFKAKLS
ncbi:carboxynorspermidine decarboxylase [Deinococcus radiopugnans]|uniref:Carboxynorspermidine decarboxylase n=1 Tax=Deinococcus radiopugnans ATCC 19172 TaxID=585398 RepID=A0A5C4XZ21_9DEIO|nr:carboxynorspermidine decarboxylase [Deinococcus radiopugnans]MBB6017980.1 carboxynorspermidine decarboxylase [Deinococcus radiopugnans ATCC 19172]TNM68851.1 carboxynorspermidine decarboxylase [Deinococcus radiopugnans ATCC 19172]